jgi:hypothetical protein
MKGVHNFSRNAWRKDQFRDLGVKWEDNLKVDPEEDMGSIQVTVAICCESDNKPSGSIKLWEFLDHLSHNQLPTFPINGAS